MSLILIFVGPLRPADASITNLTSYRDYVHRESVRRHHHTFPSINSECCDALNYVISKWQGSVVTADKVSTTGFLCENTIHRLEIERIIMLPIILMIGVARTLSTCTIHCGPPSESLVCMHKSRAVGNLLHTSSTLRFERAACISLEVPRVAESSMAPGVTSNVLFQSVSLT